MTKKRIIVVKDGMKYANAKNPSKRTKETALSKSLKRETVIHGLRGYELGKDW